MTRAAGPAGSPLTPCVILGGGGDERAQGFSAALVRAGLPPARFLDYAHFAEAPERLAALFPDGRGLLRLESPGAGSPEAEPRLRRALTRLAGAQDDPSGDAPGAATRLRPGHAVQSGLSAAIALAHRTVPPGIVATHDAAAVALLYDKRACHAAMSAAGLPVPRALPPAESVAGLLKGMRAAGLSRVFVKPRFGSGAAGIAALAVSRGECVALSSAEHVPGDGPGTLHHTHRLRRTRGAEALALVGAILAQDAHVEQWVPKATLGGHPCDLRVLVVAGEPAHTVLRLSDGPITNLDLGGRRAEAEGLRALAPPAVWEAMLADCRRFAALLPGNLHVAFDVALTVTLRRHVFFEANAFGDLIRRVRHQGHDPYSWQVARLPAWIAARRSLGLAA
ncbi:STM4014 family protein (plasmid) [Methylobacterium currus]|uniref:STM4014 family protein n=1 Tax=Methylobacterium currus TaxID=2051553 RepID=UPI001E283F36|nr:STM4014 family protein [Methylobacterium currus]UHC19927.1 STM4014 family protein [Methylobacterium currus]